jgi:hypothetical protein
MKVMERASPRSRHPFPPPNAWKVYTMTPPAAMPPLTAPRARKCVGGFCDNARRHATPPPAIPTPFRLQMRGGVCDNTRRRHATPARPSRPPPACNAWGRLRQRPLPHHRRHPSCLQTHKGCMRQRPATMPPDTPLKHLGVYALSHQFTHKHTNTLLGRKRGGVYATTPAMPRPSSPSCSQTRERVCDSAPPRQPHHAMPPASNPSCSQTCGGVCDNAPSLPPTPACKHVGVSATVPPRQPCHATPPCLQPLVLANAWGCLRQHAATSAPPRHAATPPAPRACKCVGVSATTRHHASPTTCHHFTRTVLLIYLYYTVCSLVYCCIKVVNRLFTAKKEVHLSDSMVKT